MTQFINGKLLTDTSTGATTEVIDPSNGRVIETVSLAGPDEVEQAVQAAAAAYRSWSRATPGERSAVLARFARVLESRAEEFAQVESRQAGKPTRLAREFDVPGTIDNVDFFSG